MLWTFDPKVPGALRRESLLTMVVNRGVAMYKGTHFLLAPSMED
jgi:hypothetical protein